MSRSVIAGLLLLFPRAWRARYGEELAQLVAETVAAGQSPWRVGADLVRTAAAERARSLGLIGDAVSRTDRATGGCLAVLWAWIGFVVAGAVVQKASEQWQGAIPAGDQALPTSAFAVIVAGAIVASVAVLAGIALTVPRIGVMLAAGGWSAIRGPVRRAAGLTLVAAAGTVGLAVWAQTLSSAARNGADHLYGAAFVALGLAGVATLVAWTAVAARIARRIDLGRRLLVAEAGIAVVTTVAMAAMSVASLLWWQTVAGAAPGFFAGGRVSGPMAARGHRDGRGDPRGRRRLGACATGTSARMNPRRRSQSILVRGVDAARSGTLGARRPAPLVWSP